MEPWIARTEDLRSVETRGGKPARSGSGRTPPRARSMPCAGPPLLCGADGAEVGWAGEAHESRSQEERRRADATTRRDGGHGGNGKCRKCRPALLPSGAAALK